MAIPDLSSSPWDSNPSTYPPFPEDVHTAPLVTVSLGKLEAEDTDEHGSLLAACKALGFFYLDMRGCTNGETLLQDADAMFGLMGDFFALPGAEKEKYDFSAREVYYGYKGVGAEVIDKNGTRDRNELYNACPPISKDDILSLSPPLPAPSLITDNRAALARYMASNNTVLTTLFDSLTIALALPPGTLTALHRVAASSGCHARFIRAPPQPPHDRRTALAEHTDFGSLTVLFNRVGGLQVQLPGSVAWVYVRPRPGHAIVNLGDAMVKFTGGLLRSNLHRVVAPSGAQADAVRYSLVYFCRPEHEVRLRRLTGGLLGEKASGEDGDEEASTSREWIHRRHMGRKVKFFKGPETWENTKGTEGVRV
ncbi:hypothetical protein B0A49_12721 [Cryomyces minteri]|uniref:Fe2OG dioxygenase domain-containing protein n=1 Tax=Cryomyces minteri TaxID=331657 RepID=A0A4U0WAZ7_9PEZI|nr:hypothetical protein B0A49_12721 [Cryomyces minteri]